MTEPAPPPPAASTAPTVTLEDVRAAAERLRGLAFETPLLRSVVLDRHTGATILLKPECLQRTGSFKFRGAYNRLARLDEAGRRAGVVAWSSGNHAQGIAAAGQLLGVRCAIVMPSDAPAVKRDKTAGYGAEIIEYDRYSESREEIARALAAERGAVLVPSYDDADIIAGQGTAGLELAEQAEALGLELDAVLVCCGGGGLTAGVATAVKGLRPRVAIHTVEPAGFDDHARSFEAGEIRSVDPAARSICDALQAPRPGDMTFAINRQLVAGGLVVDDDEVRAAMRYAFSELKLVLEPGGAVALAAVLQRRLPLEGRTVGVVLSGGNVDAKQFAEIVAGR
ncbi:MAG: threonine/serine dehydratase [Acidobacteria bacterium]|nr:MAG: threonine/serine dehydratase [Acidobacteriota bacterium]REK03308.1 MAG: threonine/serine dehydratase [Acidobacteriota bacterium]